MTPQELFGLVLNDVRRSTYAPRDKLDMLRLSASMRLLLFDDGQPLMHVVNKEKRAKVVFRVNNNVRVALPASRPGIAPQPYLQINYAVSPLDKPTGAVEELRLADFLGLPVARMGANIYEIHDVISQCAHILGGVHFHAA